MANNVNLVKNQFSIHSTGIDLAKIQKYKNSYYEYFSGDLELNEINVKDASSQDLLEFMEKNFLISDDFEEIIEILKIHSNLVDIMYKVPDLFNREFHGDSLILKVLYGLDGEKNLLISVNTEIDGFKACKKIEKIEDRLYADFGNGFSNLLFSAEFLK